MHTFRPSRGRVLFDVFCALGFAACLAAAWFQTGASALLPAGALAVLYGLIRAFDLGARRPSAIGANVTLELSAGDQVDLPADQGASVPLAASDQELELVEAIERVEIVEPEVPSATKARKIKAPRKPRARRKSAEDRKIAQSAAASEEDAALVATGEDEGEALAEFTGDMARIPVVPLFEPEPFVRQQRTVFGRKAS